MSDISCRTSCKWRWSWFVVQQIRPIKHAQLVVPCITREDGIKATYIPDINRRETANTLNSPKKTARLDSHNSDYITVVPKFNIFSPFVCFSIICIMDNNLIYLNN